MPVALSSCQLLLETEKQEAKEKEEEEKRQKEKEMRQSEMEEEKLCLFGLSGMFVCFLSLCLC